MSDNGMKNYPSTAVQQYPTKIAFLIDCDGGLSTAFNPQRPATIKPDLIKEFPSNSDIFLFFNSNDSSIVNRMEKLASDNPNVHTFPTISKNSRNGADINLSFMLGAISDKYDDYIIIVGRDRTYEEIKKRLEMTQPRLKNHVEIRRFNSPNELAQYARELKKFENEDQAKPIENRPPSATTSASPISVTFTSENIFRHCPLESWQQSSCLYRFKELLVHLDNKHPEVRYHYCPTCEEMIQKNDRSEYRRFQEHLQKEHLENNAGYCLSISSE